MSIPSQFGLYAIVSDPLKGFEYLTKVLVDHQVAFIQLRMKDTPIDEIRRIAEKLYGLTKGTSSRFIVNDYPRLAREIGADGVHIGQDDMSYEDTRAIVGTESIIGMSTHSPSQTERACKYKPDYIGIGPVFATPTKKNPDPVISLDGMRTMLSVATVPAVAIGGIDLSNLRQVLETGARNFCMVRQITRADDPANAVKQAINIYKEYC
jgi:thiamine-phosphate pyrophosphorylase